MMHCAKPGDVVRETSTGRTMTVEYVGDGWVRCLWFEGGTLKKGGFPVADLAKV